MIRLRLFHISYVPLNLASAFLHTQPRTCPPLTFPSIWSTVGSPKSFSSDAPCIQCPNRANHLGFPFVSGAFRRSFHVFSVLPPLHYLINFLKVPWVVPTIFAEPSLFVTPRNEFASSLHRTFHVRFLVYFLARFLLKFLYISLAPLWIHPAIPCAPQGASDWVSSHYHGCTVVAPRVPSHVYFRSP